MQVQPYRRTSRREGKGKAHPTIRWCVIKRPFNNDLDILRLKNLFLMILTTPRLKVNRVK